MINHFFWKIGDKGFALTGIRDYLYTCSKTWQTSQRSGLMLSLMGYNELKHEHYDPIEAESIYSKKRLRHSCLSSRPTSLFFLKCVFTLSKSSDTTSDYLLPNHENNLNYTITKEFAIQNILSLLKEAGLTDFVEEQIEKEIETLATTETMLRLIDSQSPSELMQNKSSKVFITFDSILDFLISKFVDNMIINADELALKMKLATRGYSEENLLFDEFVDAVIMHSNLRLGILLTTIVWRMIYY